MDAAAVRLHSGKDQNPNKPWSVPYGWLAIAKTIAARACWVSARGRFGLKNCPIKVGVLLMRNNTSSYMTACTSGDGAKDELLRGVGRQLRRD